MPGRGHGAMRIPVESKVWETGTTYWDRCRHQAGVPKKSILTVPSSWRKKRMRCRGEEWRQTCWRVGRVHGLGWARARSPQVHQGIVWFRFGQGSTLRSMDVHVLNPGVLCILLERRHVVEKALPVRHNKVFRNIHPIFVWPFSHKKCLEK
jgi:hypothetical protein